MGRIGWITALVLALVVGFAAGWLVFAGGGGADDEARACAAAEELPPALDREGEVDAERLALLNKMVAVGLLAQAAGQDGDGLDDLDELGRAGHDLQAVVQRNDLGAYGDARQALLDACG